MDRQIVYAGSIPLDTDLLSVQRNTMTAIGYLAQTVLGTSMIAEGLACLPTSPASLSVNVGPGSLTQLGAVDATPFGALPAQAGQSLVRMGINTGSTSFALTPPAASGQVITYLVEATLAETDGGQVVLPYYNASNPSQPFSGPANSGGAQMTVRRQVVQLAVKPGPAVAAGGQSLPAVDAGWVGLYTVTVASGQQAITAGNIGTLPTAPFLTCKLPQLTPGTHNLAVFQPTTQGSWTVPAGVSVLRLRVWGGGGAGGNGFGGAGGGGAGGGYAEGYVGVTAGQTFAVTVGNGGAGAGTNGGSSSFGNLASASGGSAGASGSPNGGGAGGTVVGAGFGLNLSVPGGAGGDAVNLGSNWLSGTGGGGFGSAGALPANGASGALLIGRNGAGPGSGASGGVGSGTGGQGGPGLVLVEW